VGLLDIPEQVTSQKLNKNYLNYSGNWNDMLPVDDSLSGRE